MLVPGATVAFDTQAPLTPLGATVERTGDVAAGQFHALALWLPEGATVAVEVALAGERAVVIPYGPRDGLGAFGTCLDALLASDDGARVDLTLSAPDAESEGEYLVLVGARPGGHAGRYTLSARCVEGCSPAAPACPTLAERGCPDAACAGALETDAAGCLTCACRDDVPCGPTRSAGPGGTCVRPACDCPDATAPVCAADGSTYPSACHALCAGASVLKAGACSAACPDLAACDAPCAGPRAVDAASGCPTCACARALPESDADCAACPPEAGPVCGTDGVTYPTRCDARCAGARILYAAACVAECLAPPSGCTLDCPFGLRISATAGGCVECACATAPSDACETDGAPVCVSFPAFSTPTTAGSACLALHLGASGGQWGPCGLPCASDEDCEADAKCATEGLLVGRCVSRAPRDCACAAVVDPVCASDGVSYANACLAACAGAQVVMSGLCCEVVTSEGCDAGQRRPVDFRGCPRPSEACVDVGAAGLCREGAPGPAACAPDGTPTQGTACEAHRLGLAASPRWCSP
jgi:hypothetical protein